MRALVVLLALCSTVGCDTQVVELAADSGEPNSPADATTTPADTGTADSGLSVDSGQQEDAAVDAGFIDASMPCSCALPCRADSDCSPVGPTAICAGGVCDEKGSTCATAVDCIGGWICVSDTLGLCQ